MTVYLIEAADRTPGAGLSGPAREGMEQVLRLILREGAFKDAAR